MDMNIFPRGKHSREITLALMSFIMYILALPMVTEVSFIDGKLPVKPPKIQSLSPQVVKITIFCFREVSSSSIYSILTRVRGGAYLQWVWPSAAWFRGFMARTGSMETCAKCSSTKLC